MSVSPPGPHGVDGGRRDEVREAMFFPFSAGLAAAAVVDLCHFRLYLEVMPMRNLLRQHRCGAVLMVLLLCLLLPACGKQRKLTRANFDKCFRNISLKDAQEYLGKGHELTKEGSGGASSVGAAAGIDMP